MIPTLATIAFLIYPSVCLPSYLIELKNGHQFITYQYWEEGNQVKFFYYGGEVGIQKDLVREIRESDLVYKEQTEAQEDVVANGKTEKQGGRTPGKEADEEKGEGEDIDTEYYKNRKKEIEEKYREVKKKLKQAIVDRDKLAQREAKKEIEELDEQRSNLASELKEKNKGVLPNWW